MGAQVYISKANIFTSVALSWLLFFAITVCIVYEPIVRDLTTGEILIDYHDKSEFVVKVSYALTVITISMGALLMGTYIRFSAPNKLVTLGLMLSYSVIAIFIFAGIYRIFGVYHSVEGVPTMATLGEGLYFSIVTWTTLGYGDYSPLEEIQMISALQAMIGYLYFGVVVGTIASWIKD